MVESIDGSTTEANHSFKSSPWEGKEGLAGRVLGEALNRSFHAFIDVDIAASRKRLRIIV
jgi:hypothetical protein